MVTEQSVPDFTISLEDVERLHLVLTHAREQLYERIDWLRAVRRDQATAEEFEQALKELGIMVGVFLTREEVQPYRKHRDIDLR